MQIEDTKPEAVTRQLTEGEILIGENMGREWVSNEHSVILQIKRVISADTRSI